MVLATQKNNNWVKAFLKNVSPGLIIDILRYVKHELRNFEVDLTLVSVNRISKCDYWNENYYYAETYSPVVLWSFFVFRYCDTLYITFAVFSFFFFFAHLTVMELATQKTIIG